MRLLQAMKLFREKKIVQNNVSTHARRISLDMCPVKNIHVEEEYFDSGFVRLSYPVTIKPWFASVAKRFGVWDGSPMQKTIELDEMGTAAWELIDGRNRFLDLVDIFTKRYNIQNKEAETSLAAFLRELGQRGLVAFTEQPTEQIQT